MPFSTKPLYQQLREVLEANITAGVWKPNHNIPNENDLAREYGVSPGTIRKALHLLEGDHLVTRRQGRGTVVNDFQSPALLSRFSNQFSSEDDRLIGEIRVRRVERGRATATECERLRLSDDAEVYRLARVRSYRGIPFLIENTSMPVALYPELIERGWQANPVTTLAGLYGFVLGSSVEKVLPGIASPEAGHLLNVAEGTPVLILDRLIKTRDGVPAQLRLGEWCATGDMHYRIET